jgi:acetyl-CoA acetyltransferase
MKLWAAHRERIGVSLAMVGKTARSAAVAERIYLQRVLRLLEEHAASAGIDREAFGRLTRRLADAVIRETLPSNPFTLVGAMPNFCATRVANMFDLNGPSVVIDAGGASLLEAVRQAHHWLAFGEADVVLTGGVDTAVGTSCLLAVTTPKLARAHDWVIEVLAQVDDPDDGAVTLRAPNAEPSKRVLPMEATFARYAARITGVTEIIAAIEATKKGKVATLRWRADQSAVRGTYAGQSATTPGAASHV